LLNATKQLYKDAMKRLQEKLRIMKSLLCDSIKEAENQEMVVPEITSKSVDEKSLISDKGKATLRNHQAESLINRLCLPSPAPISGFEFVNNLDSSKFGIPSAHRDISYGLPTNSIPAINIMRTAKQDNQIENIKDKWPTLQGEEQKAAEATAVAGFTKAARLQAEKDDEERKTAEAIAAAEATKAARMEAEKDEKKGEIAEAIASVEATEAARL